MVEYLGGLVGPSAMAAPSVSFFLSRLPVSHSEHPSAPALISRRWVQYMVFW